MNTQLFPRRKMTGSEGGGALAEHGSSGSFAGMSIAVIVENDTSRLPAHVPDGTRAEIFLPGKYGPQGSAEKMDTLRIFIGCSHDVPEDLAAAG